MHVHHRTTTLLLTVLALIATTGVSAQDVFSRDERASQQAREWWPRERNYYVQSGVSLDQAAQMAQRRFNARVVKAETVRSGDRQVHQIRLLNAEGKVWTVRVDAETGRMF